MDLTNSTGQIALQAMDFIASREAEFRERSPNFADAAFRALATLEERALLLQLLERCPIPQSLGDAEISIARHRGTYIVFQALHPDLEPVWFNHEMKFHLGFGCRLDRPTRAAVKTWFCAALVLAQDRLAFPN